MSKPIARITIGKLAVARCGHRGEHVIGQYIQCIEGCSEEAATVPEIHDRCPDCGGKEIDLDYQVDPLYLAWNPAATLYNWRCWDCGRLRKV